MRTASPLPPELRGRPLTASVLRSSGIDPDRLRRQDITALGSGIHLERSLADSLDTRTLLRLRALGVLGEHPAAWVSHTTTARLMGLPLPRAVEDALHISVPAGAPRVRRNGVRAHHADVLPEELRLTGDGLTLSRPHRMWRECAGVLPLDDLIALGDALVRHPRRRYEGRSEPFTTVEELSAAVALHPRLRGHRRALQALGMVRVGADSAQETRLRLALVRAGLPEPALQIPADPGDPSSPCADAAYVESRLALQYDGGVHFEAERAKRDRRVDRIFASRGWTVLRYYDDDARQGFRRAVVEVRRFLADTR